MMLKIMKDKHSCCGSLRENRVTFSNVYYVTLKKECGRPSESRDTENSFVCSVLCQLDSAKIPKQPITQHFQEVSRRVRVAFQFCQNYVNQFALFS